MSHHKQEIHRLASYAVIFLSIAALLTVISGFTEPPQADEGTGAHIFQLSIVALVPMIPLFLATADWRRPWRFLRPLAISGAALVLAFGALYYLEHYRDPNYRPHAELIQENAVGTLPEDPAHPAISWEPTGISLFVAASFSFFV